MSTCNRSDLQTPASEPIMPKNSPITTAIENTRSERAVSGRPVCANVWLKLHQKEAHSSSATVWCSVANNLLKLQEEKIIELSGKSVSVRVLSGAD
jgi:hypothetical protein